MKRQLKHLLWIGVLVLATLVAGCGSKSPSETVEAAYMAANAGDYSEADEYLSAAVLPLVNAFGGSQEGWDKATRDKTIKSIDILDENIDGEKAVCKMKIHYEDGKTDEQEEYLVLEDGDWKITIR